MRVIPSANINGAVVGDGFEQFQELPGKNDIDPTLDGRQERDIEIDCNHIPDDSSGEDHIDKNMKE